MPEIILNPSKPPEFLHNNNHVSIAQSTEGWDIFRIAPKEDVPAAAQKRLVYIHGGAFVWHMIDLQWKFIDSIVSQTGAEVIIPAYPLAPYPEASERQGSALTVVPKMAEFLHTTIAESNSPTILMGDSAGGNIAVAALMANRDKGVRQPDRTVLLSPWLDLALPAEEVGHIAAPGMFVDLLQRDAEAWRGNLPIENPLASPVHGQLHDLGKIAVFCGTADVVYPGCQRFVDKATGANGTVVEYHQYADEAHNNLISGTDIGLHARADVYDFIVKVA